MPSATVSRYATGTLRSIQKTIGCFGSDIAAVGSFFSSRQRFTKNLRGVGDASPS